MHRFHQHVDRPTPLRAFGVPPVRHGPQLPTQRHTAAALPALNRLHALRASGLRVRHCGIAAASQLQQAQRQMGNARLRRLLDTTANTTPVPTVSPARLESRAPAIQLSPAPALTRAGQETKARRTQNRLRGILLRMLRHSNRMFANTARLFTRWGTRAARLTARAMTLRSDSARLVRTRHQDARQTAYYFYAVTQTNTHRHGPRTIGTVDGNTILVRGRSAGGTRRSATQIMNTLVHEASHILVASYGEHPRTRTSASSFDRYKDEFRAYWVEPTGHWGRMRANDAKARAIREQLVGTGRTDTRGYPDLRQRYWTNAGFKRRVDAHRRPDGFNLRNSRPLDILFQILQETRARPGRLDYLLMHITRYLDRSERAEAHASPLIQRMIRALRGEASTRVRNALRYPTDPGHARLVNPFGSQRVRFLLSGIAIRNEVAYKSAYRRLSRRELNHYRWRPAGLLVFIRRQVSDLVQRVSIYALILGRGAAQHDAMRNFLRACQRARRAAAAAGGRLRAIPAYVQTALNPLTHRSRLALYRLVEPARRAFVDVLPEPVRSRLLRMLRSGGEP